MANIDQLKGIFGAKDGPALGHQYIVELPDIPGDNNLSGEERTLLCKAARLPGRQIQAYDRNVGIMNQKIAYGYGLAEVSLSFHLLNDYGTRKYWDDWQNLIINQDNHQIQYSDNYKKTVKIYQVRRATKVVKENGIVDPSTESKEIKIYGVELESAFPITVNGIELGDALNDQLIDVSVDLSFKNWRRVGATGSVDSPSVGGFNWKAAFTNQAQNLTKNSIEKAFNKTGVGQAFTQVNNFANNVSDLFDNFFN